MDREAEVTTVRLPGVSISISTVFVLYVQLGSLRFAHLFFVNNSALDASIFKISGKLGVFWNPQELLLMMGTDLNDPNCI